MVLKEFRSLCGSEGLSIGQCIERFMQACVQAGEISGVVDLLAQVNQGQLLANELRLRRLMADLEVSMANEDVYEVWSGMDGVERMLPRIRNDDLLEKAGELLEAAMSYYRKAAVKTQK